MLGLVLNLPPEAGVVVGGKRVAEDLDLVMPVEARDTLHEVGGRVIAEVRGDKANPQTTSALDQTTRVLEGSLV